MSADLATCAIAYTVLASFRVSCAGWCADSRRICGGDALHSSWDVMACTSRTSKIKCNSIDVTARRTQTTCCLAPADLALALQEADLKGG